MDGTSEDHAMGDTSADEEDSGFFEEEASLTHPRCYSSDHVEKLETFAEDLNHALKTSFPSGPNHYTAVHVLLLRWADDDLGIQSEISTLHSVFEARFHFDVEEWQIPSLNPTRALQKKLYGFQDAHQRETELLIVYYGGHAKSDYRRGRSIWQAYCQPDSPSLNWSSLQPLLETAVPHVLIILDCCFAASAARDTTEGTTKEILAACGRESPTLGVGQRSFTSALIEEMQAFDGAPFTATMLHSRLVTMRWRLVFTPIYALLSERGGNSITICPLFDVGASTRPESQLLAELEATEPSQQGQGPITPDDPPSLQASQQQTVDTRVLLSVSVLQDAIPNISHWVSWLTTAAPWDVTGVDVKVESIFRSYSALILVSIPTYAWSRLPERPAYRFVGFIRSGDMFQAAKTSTPLITETLPRAVASPLPPDVLLRPIDKAGATLNPTDWQDESLSSPEIQSSRQRHKRQRTDVVAQPAAEMSRHFARFPVSGASKSPSTAGPDLGNTPKRKNKTPIWSPEDDELLMRARREGLKWNPIAVKYFPDKTANACRKHHEQLMTSADNVENIDIDKLSKAYLESREHMWRLLADRVGEDWQAVEAKCMAEGLDKELGRKTSRSERSFDPLDYLDDEEPFGDSAIGVDDFSHNALGSSKDTLYDGRKERSKSVKNFNLNPTSDPLYNVG